MKPNKAVKRAPLVSKAERKLSPAAASRIRAKVGRVLGGTAGAAY